MVASTRAAFLGGARGRASRCGASSVRAWSCRSATACSARGQPVGGARSLPAAGGAAAPRGSRPPAQERPD